MTFITQEQIRQGRDNAQHAALVERGLWQVFNAFPDLVVNDANANLIRRWCSEFSGMPDAVPSVGLFKQARDANRDLWRREFVFKPLGDQINELISECVALLRAIGTPENSMKAELFKLKGYTRDQLLACRHKLQTRQEYKKLPAADLKQKLAGFREAEARYAQRDFLPPEFTAERLKNNVELLKHCVRRFGVDAVNSRLRGES